MSPQKKHPLRKFFALLQKSVEAGFFLVFLIVIFWMVRGLVLDRPETSIGANTATDCSGESSFLPVVVNDNNSPTPLPETPAPTPTCANTATSTPSQTPTVTLTPSPTYTPTAFAGNWEEVGEGSAEGGGISNDSALSQDASVAVAPDGVPYVAWHSADSNTEIFVRRWNGSSWEEVGSGSASGGGISNNDGISEHPSVAIAPNGVPYIAWHDFSSGDPEIYIRRWNGSIWEEVGAGSAAEGGISDNDTGSAGASLAIAPDGTPYVAWGDGIYPNGDIYVRRWNGSTWEEVGAGSATGGGISNNEGWSAIPAIAIAPDGTPYVAWIDDGNGNGEIYIRHWNGSSWEEIGSSSAAGGGISNSSGNSVVSDIAFAVDGTPYVSWGDNSSGSYQIYIRHWNGSSWEEVGMGSATGAGISQSEGEAGRGSVAVTSDGIPFVVWDDDSSGNAEIYVRYWNGSSWEEMGVGAATGGGISQNSGDSFYPQSALAPDGTIYVTWDDQSNGWGEIYVRRWMASP